MSKGTKKGRKNATVHFKRNLWDTTPKLLIDTIYEHLREFTVLSPDYFMELHQSLLRGGPSYDHKYNLCEIVDSLGLCNKCKYRNSKNCTLEVVTNKDRTSAALAILQMTDSITLFNDKYNAYVWLEIGGHRRIVSLNSNLFAQWVSLTLYKAEGKPPSSDAINAAKNVLIARAFLESVEITLYNRVAWHEGNLYFDMSDSKNRAVQISTDGWKIREYTPIPMFKRYDHQRASFHPLQQGPRTPKELRAGLERILDFLNHDTNDKATRILMLVAIVTNFIEGIPHAAIMLHGEHGAAKSTFSEVIKRLVDPSGAPVMGFPKGSDNIVQAIDHHWFPVFDNITDLKDWQSDIICRAITGGGTQTRKLYSDDGVVIRYYQRCFSLNGISNVVERPDLLDRSVLFKLPRVPDEKRRDLKEFWKDFDTEAPLILGTIFDILSKAIAIYPTIRTTGLYRLADWCKWGCAICRAIGIDDNDFLNAYAQNRVEQTDEAIGASVEASAIYALMNDRPSWEGNMTELLNDLCQISSSIGISTDAKEWPKSSRVLSQQIPKIQTSLRESGIEMIETGRDKGNRKTWTITKFVVGSTVRSITESTSGLEHYLNEPDNASDASESDSCVSSKCVIQQGEAESNAPNAHNARNEQELGRIPKDVKGSIEGSAAEAFRDAQDLRFIDFMHRANMEVTGAWISEIDLDTMYAKKPERERVVRDLEDWETIGKVAAKEKPLRWRITESIK